MPEFMGVKITRAEEKARHAYSRELDRAMRAASKGSPWKCNQGSVFLARGDWFACVSPSVHIFEHVTSADLNIKPMGVDPIFWDIVQLPENKKLPLSFRLRGAWTCRGPSVLEGRMDERSMDAAAVAPAVVSWATEQLERVLPAYSIDCYAEFIESDPNQRERGSYLPSLVTTLILLGRFEEARRACETARDQGNVGGFLAPSGTFPEMALAWLASQAASRTIN